MPRRRLTRRLAGLVVGLPLLAGLVWLGRELLRPIPPTPQPLPVEVTASAPRGGGGGLIAFESGGDLYVMRADGGGRTNLTRTPDLVESAPTWSPDGQSIAFLRDLGTGDRALYVMPALREAGAAEPRAVSRAVSPSGALAWSPDGTRLVLDVVEGGDGARPLTNIALFDVGGSGRVGWPAAPLAGLNCSSPRWSPDGTQLAVLCAPEGVAGLYVIDADGAHLTMLQSPAGPFDWSPDGQRLFDLAGGRLRVMRRDGSGLTTLAQVESLGGGAVSVSPDGQRLALSYNGRDGYQIAVAWSDGSNIVPLTRPPDTALEPRWSPDGDWLLYTVIAAAPATVAGVGEVAAPSALFAVEVQAAVRDPGSVRPIQLTPFGLDSNPRWQP